MRNSLVLFLLSAALLLTCTIIHYQDKGVPKDNASGEISARLTRVFQVVDQQAAQLLRSPVDETVWLSASHAFYLVEKSGITRWNQNGFIPDIRLVRNAAETQFIQVTRGSFITRSWPVDSSRFLFCVVPLAQRYKITNRYLVPEWNRSIFDELKPVLLDRSDASGVPVRLDNRVLFKMVADPDSGRSRLSGLILGFGGAAMLSFLAALFMLIRYFHTAGRPLMALLILLSGLMSIRWLMVGLNFPGSYSELSIFDPLQFASSVLNPSIGDLFLNSVFIVIVAFFLFFNNRSLKPFIKQRKGRAAAYTWAVIFLLLAFFALVVPFLFIETIYHNSSLSLDFAQSIEFDGVRFLAFLSVAMSCVAAFLLSHFFFRLGIQRLPKKGFTFFIALSGATLLLFAYYMLAGRDYTITLTIGFCYFSLLYYSRLHKSVLRFSFVTFLYFFAFVTAASVQTAFSIRSLEEEEHRDLKFRFANTVLVGRDILGEYLLRESTQQITRDPFLKMGFSSPFISNTSMRQKIKEAFINSYFDRYDVQIKLYSASGKSLDGGDDLTTLLKSSEKEADTQYSGIYFIKGGNSGSGKKYLVIVPVERASYPTGFVVLELSLKRIIPQNVYPELLVDNRFINFFSDKEFSYAFFSSGSLTGSFGQYNYENDFPQPLLSNPGLYSHGLVAQGFSHIGVEDDENKVAIVSSPLYNLFSVLANFAFFFIVGLGLIFFAIIFSGAISWNRGERLTYATRIQMYVYMGFLLPLVAVSITTVGVIGLSAKDQLYREFHERAKAMGEQLNSELTTAADPALLTDFGSRLISQAKLANLDATVYLPSGHLLASSQPSIFQDQLISELINREAWRHITTGHEGSFIAEESIGLLNFSNSYIALKSPVTGQLTGILSVPFFDSEHSLERQQINVLANIAIIFVLIFILFLLISFFAVRWLTFPLRWITRSLSRTTLGGQNTPLQWNSNDEIGLMVREYNKMVENLESSKVELARSQKESAWREIAKQIAHEIKNPLTPMRLTLQRVEQFVKSGTLSNEVAEQSVQTLLTQVEILNDIASSFSAFARMPAPILQKMDVTALLKKVVDLHASYPSGGIVMKESRPIMIMGDEQLLSRVFSNIVLNALQSADDGLKLKIEIEATWDAAFSVITIRDNGKGIDEGVKEKVFLPHFSTKKSGSGLGLAIAKQGIEQSGGTIWFESNPGKGTTFFVKIPLAG